MRRERSDRTGAVEAPALGPGGARPAAGAVHVGVAGSVLKFLDGVPLALPALLAAGRRPGVALHFFGGFPGPFGAAGRDPGRPGSYDLDGVPYRYHPIDTDLRRYHRAAGVLDVSLGPLNPAMPINRSRSAQRWMEAALHGTAMVLQRLEPYDVAEDGVTCLKAGGVDEWTEQVLRLVDDAALRRRIGEAARAEVLARHTIEARRPLWEALVAEARAGRLGERPRTVA